MAVEQAFGRLKQRFRTLKKVMEEKSPERSARVLVACMVLHNVLIDLGDVTSLDAEDNAENEEVEETIIASDRPRRVRDKLAANLAKQNEMIYMSR